ncbi:hypothetical protein JW964_13875 [candidate division KSB1 bacterium]|nr:hypothetical protein [candidate division KSB1 bacterium]
MNAKRFLYTPMPGFPGGMPFVEIQLFGKDRPMSVPALVDSGSALIKSNYRKHDEIF